MLTREEVEKMRKSGEIPTVNLKIFDNRLLAKLITT